MNSNLLIETFGTIIKEESLATLDHNIIENTFVVETMFPFPGYHGSNFSEQQMLPKSVFFILKSWVSTEDLFRMIKNIKKYFKHEFDASPAELVINNIHYDAIRVKDLKSMSFIEELQRHFRDEGVQFLKSKKVDTKGIIKIKKYLLLTQINDNIWLDRDNESFAYIRVPVKLNWQVFENMTINIRRNIQHKNFDAAQGVIFRKSGIIDVVRVFDIDLKIENLEILLNKYLEEIRKLQFDPIAAK